MHHYTAQRIGPQSLLIVGGLWIQSSLLSAAMPCFNNQINRRIYIANLGIDGYTISWKSKYLPEITYRTYPLCFKLKNNLYICGHNPIRNSDFSLNDFDQLVMCPMCKHKERDETHNKHLEYPAHIADCTCCDKFEFSNEKCSRNVCSLPKPLRHIIWMKVTTNKNESMAIIEFYDLVDCRDKIWIFTEKEERFEEYWDPDSKICSLCQELQSLNSREIEHRKHASSNTCILTIK